MLAQVVAVAATLRVVRARPWAAQRRPAEAKARVDRFRQAVSLRLVEAPHREDPQRAVVPVAPAARADRQPRVARAVPTAREGVPRRPTVPMSCRRPIHVPTGRAGTNARRPIWWTATSAKRPVAAAAVARAPAAPADPATPAVRAAPPAPAQEAAAAVAWFRPEARTRKSAAATAGPRATGTAASPPAPGRPTFSPARKTAQPASATKTPRAAAKVA